MVEAALPGVHLLPRRGKRLRWPLLRHVVLVVVGCCSVALLCVFFVALFRKAPTSFVARVETTALSFTTAPSKAGEGDTSIFAPSRGPLDIAVQGCATLDPLSEQATGSIPCKERFLQLAGVRLSSLVLVPQTRVTLNMLDGGVRIQLHLPPDASGFRCVVFAEPESRVVDAAAESTASAGSALPRGEWLLRPGQNDLVLSLIEAGGVKALRDEQAIGLAGGSGLYLEQHEESALTGTDNSLEIPLGGEKKVALDANRLQLLQLHEGSIQHLRWVRGASGPLSMRLVISGESKQINLLGDYSSEAANYANTLFDNFNKGRYTQSLIAAATTVGVLATVFGGMATCGMWWNDTQKIRSGKKHAPE